jgi:hypothetical protein
MSSAVVDDLQRCGIGELGRRFRQGRPVSSSMLAGRRWQGRTLGLPFIAQRLSWQTFRKDIDVAGADGVIRGVNVRVPQTWQAASLPERTVMPFVVRDVDGGAVIDYRPTHFLPNPMGLGVDPLVRVDDDDDWITVLGVTELWLGRRRLVRTPTWFSLTSANED